jgi:hypothetical protein
VTFSPGYEAISRRVPMVGGLANLLILTAVFFMTAKPFA